MNFPGGGERQTPVAARQSKRSFDEWEITVRAYPVREVSRRLGVSTRSLYKWMKLFGEQAPKPGLDHEAENHRLKRELAGVIEERDMLKQATVYFARGSQ